MTALHLLFLCIAIPAVLYADLQGFLWMRGGQLNGRLMDRLHTVVYAALGGLVLTGLMLFLERSARLLDNPAFYMKMFLVGVLVFNSFLIGRHLRLAKARPFYALETREKSVLIASGVVSTLGWLGAIAGGMLIG